MSRKEYEYTRQRVIKEYKQKFNCQKEGCILYPCYVQWFCEGLSFEGKVVLGIDGACVANRIKNICDENGKKRTTWEEVLFGLGEERDLKVDRLLKDLDGEISSFKRTLNGIEKNNNGLSPQKIGFGANRLFRNVWLVYTDELTVARNLAVFQAGHKDASDGEGAQRRHISKIITEDEGNYP